MIVKCLNRHKNTVFISFLLIRTDLINKEKTVHLKMLEKHRRYAYNITNQQEID